ncbi:MAG: hemerythrin domain-containing protein [Rhodoferax sp.]|jgi:hemerythrin-like domain-containing protein|nr:hemerythrin domain-containing protein [Rhodoferax sp.]MCP5263979.1 hemerythrin domain-containing protein [Rhodoferax sp.]
MSFNRQVGRALDEEHRNYLELLGKLEHSLARAKTGDAELGPLMAQFARAMEHDIERHFRFEEESLFPLMRDAGDGEMADLLVDEHETLREVATELLPLARAAAAGPLDAAQWGKLRLHAQEMIERQVAHIQKETMALLPMLDDLLDEQSDRELAFAYACD